MIADRHSITDGGFYLPASFSRDIKVAKVTAVTQTAHDTRITVTFSCDIITLADECTDFITATLLTARR